jgi:hypothetical protein
MPSLEIVRTRTINLAEFAVWTLFRIPQVLNHGCSSGQSAIFVSFWVMITH